MQKALIDIEVQRKWIRTGAVVVAIMVIVGAAALEWLIVCQLLYSKTPNSGFLAAWAIAPIVSITLVTAFLLLGAFAKQSDNLSSALVQLLVKGGGSN